MTLTGTGAYSGGTFTALPAGLSINSSNGEITPSTSTPGTYTVTYTTSASGGCAAVPVTTSVTITLASNATISYAGTPFCKSVATPQPVTRTGTPGGTYSAVPAGLSINAGNGAITPSTSTAGTYTVTYTIAASGGCALFSTTTSVTINALPVPTISGPASVCVGSIGNLYFTEPGMTNYTWTVSAGGTITAGAGTNSITVTWTTAGLKTITVSYTDANGCNAASPSVYNVTVSSLPAPTITGPATACIGSIGNVYTTQPGMTNYIWIVSAGGAITAGGGPGNNTVTVTWNTLGAQTVSVNYTNGNGCTAASSTTYNVNVTPLPVPTISGPTPVCAGSINNVYTTQAGMTNYQWIVSSGGTITAGGGAGNNTVTVTWNTAGARTVSVNYTNSNGCTATTPVIYNVTVNPLPVPTITGPSNVCAGSTGNVYISEPGMTNYIWTVSAGGAITSGGTSSSNTVTITWNTVGPQTVSVSYTSLGCSAATPTIYNVTVNTVPVPTLTGPISACVGSTGNIYTTDPGMSNYIWTVSGGGTITAGGTTTSNTATITWNSSGNQTVSVMYTNSNGCTAPGTPTTLNITVNPLPNPTISGPNSVCVGSTGNLYTTQAGMSNYIWTVVGGTITAGGGAGNSTVTVTWNTTGTQSVSVNYTNGNGCTAASPTIYSVLVNQLRLPPFPGPNSVAQNPTGILYTTQHGMTNYL